MTAIIGFFIMTVLREQANGIDTGAEVLLKYWLVGAQEESGQVLALLIGSHALTGRCFGKSQHKQSLDKFSHTDIRDDGVRNEHRSEPVFLLRMVERGIGKCWVDVQFLTCILKVLDGTCCRTQVSLLRLPSTNTPGANVQPQVSNCASSGSVTDSVFFATALLITPQR